MEAEQIEAVMGHIKALLQLDTTPTENEGADHPYDAYLTSHPEMREGDSLLIGLALAERMGVNADLQVATQITEKLRGLAAHLNSPHETTAALSLSRFYRLQQQLQAAEMQLNDAQDLLYQHKQDELRSGLALERAALFQRLQQPQDAARVLDGAIEALAQSETDDTYGLAQLHLERGQVLRQLDQLPDALEALQTSLSLQSQLGEPDPIGLANTQLALGNIYRLQSMYSEAEDAIHKALPLYQGVGDARGLGSACLELGQLYQQLGHHEGTDAALHNALQVFQQAHHSEQICITYQRMANTYLERKLFDDATEALRQALALATQHQLPNESILNAIALLPDDNELKLEHTPTEP